MSKRRKFLLASFILSLGLLGVQYISLDYKYLGVIGFFLVSYLVSAWVLFDDLKGVEWLTIVSVPALYAASVALFYFLLPSGWLARLAILSLFGLGMYSLYLTSNIYSVAAIRTIQLLRAAHAVGFLLTLLTLVLSYNTIFSLKLHPWWNGMLAAVISFPLLLSGLWSIDLAEIIPPRLWRLAGGLSVLVLEVAVVLSFLPVTVWVASLFLATFVYVGLGLLQHELVERLFARTLNEYVTVGLFVLLATFLVTTWK